MSYSSVGVRDFCDVHRSVLSGRDVEGSGSEQLGTFLVLLVRLKMQAKHVENTSLYSQKPYTKLSATHISFATGSFIPTLGSVYGTLAYQCYKKNKYVVHSHFRYQSLKVSPFQKVDQF